MEPEKLTSVQIAEKFGLSRARVEVVLVELGLRGPGDDGSTRYHMTAVTQALYERDQRQVTALVAHLDGIADQVLVRQVAAEAFRELAQRAIADSGSIPQLLHAAKQQIIETVRGTYAFQYARSEGGDIGAWRQLAAMEDLELRLNAGLAERRAEKKQDDAPAKPADSVKPPAKGRGRRAGRKNGSDEEESHVGE
ncbi:MAG: hypothetical protein KBE65_11370 [Phycisphaerae bacterium]|nr:hypothetical protein [Phycisphaerae bacterium]